MEEDSIYLEREKRQHKCKECKLYYHSFLYKCIHSLVNTCKIIFLTLNDSFNVKISHGKGSGSTPLGIQPMTRSVNSFTRYFSILTWFWKCFRPHCSFFLNMTWLFFHVFFPSKIFDRYSNDDLIHRGSLVPRAGTNLTHT